VVSVSTSGSDIFYDLAPVTAPDRQSTAVTDVAAVAPAPSSIFYDL
jgi:hypothetical protein